MCVRENTGDSYGSSWSAYIPVFCWQNPVHAVGLHGQGLDLCNRLALLPAFPLLFPSPVFRNCYFWRQRFISKKGARNTSVAIMTKQSTTIANKTSPPNAPR